MVSLVEVEGSAPREPGARLIVTPRGYHGTIGGGALEWRAIALAQARLGKGPSVNFMTQALGPELGQCCGGRVKLLTEVFDRSRLDEARRLAAEEPFVSESVILADRVERRIDTPRPATAGRGRGPLRQQREGEGHPVAEGTIQNKAAEPAARGEEAGNRDAPHPPIASQWAPPSPRSAGERWSSSPPKPGLTFIEHFGDHRRPLWLFGAGHVGRALVLALAQLPFAVTWIDSRPDAFPSAMPANVEAKCSPSPPDELAKAPDRAFILVMTHSHALDLAIVERAMREARFGYLGLIGSATKRARFVSRLRAGGIPEDRIAELVCPIGVAGIKGKEPAVIAAATAAELLQRDEVSALNPLAVPAEPSKMAQGRV